MYWKQTRYEEARKAFEAELANQPQHTLALAYLADAEMHSSSEKSAEEHLRRALRLDANLRLAHLDLGILLAERNENGEAARHFQEAIRLDPSRSDAHYRLGRLGLATGRKQEAEAEFAVVKHLAKPEQPEALVDVPGCQ